LSSDLQFLQAFFSSYLPTVTVSSRYCQPCIINVSTRMRNLTLVLMWAKGGESPIRTLISALSTLQAEVWPQWQNRLGTHHSSTSQQLWIKAWRSVNFPN
jgi:hypothetical protein